MKDELKNKLFESYPILYAGYTDFPNYGIACGDGWFDLLNELSAKLEKILEDDLLNNDFRVLQIKEKFGGLRFYISGKHIEVVSEAILEAYKKSTKTCEVTGKPGEPYDVNGWIRCLCEEEVVARRAQGKTVEKLSDTMRGYVAT